MTTREQDANERLQPTGRGAGKHLWQIVRPAAAPLPAAEAGRSASYSHKLNMKNVFRIRVIIHE